MKNKILGILALLALSTSFFYFYKTRQVDLFLPEIVDYPHQSGRNALFEKADGYKYAQDYKKAETAFQRLLTQPLSTADSQYVLNQLAYINLTINEDTTAAYWIRVLEKSKAPLSKEALADYDFNIGVWAYHTFKPKMAEAYLQKALQGYRGLYGEQHLRVGLCLTALGMMHYEFAQTLDSLFKYVPIGYSIFKNSLNLERFSGYPEFAMAINTYMHWETDNAIIHCDNALNLFRKTLSKDPILISRALSFRGFLTRIKADTEYDSIQKKHYYSLADSFYVKSVEFSNLKKGIRQQEIMRGIIRFKAQKADFESANNYLKELEHLNKYSKIEFGHINLLKGYYFQKTNDIQKSIGFYRLFWNVYKNDTAKHYVYLGETAQMLFNHYKSLNNFDSASYFIKQNILVNTPFLGQDLSWDKMLKEDVYGSYKHLLVSYGLAADLFIKKYNQQNDKKALELAFQIFKLTDNYLFQNIFSAEDEAVISYQKEYGEQAYTLAIETAYILFKNTHKKEYADYGFRFIERMKAFIMFKNTSVKQNDNNLQIKLDSIKLLKLKKAQIVNLLTKNNNGESLLTKIELEQKQLYSNIEKNYPLYAKEKSNQKISTLDSIQKILKSDELLIQYSLNKKSYYRMAISPTSYQFEKYDSVINLNNDVKLLKQHLSSNDFSNINSSENLSKVSYSLYQKLLSNLPTKSKKNLKFIIIPDKELNLIPFEALIIKASNPNNKSNNFNGFEYVVNFFEIIYAPSWKIFEHNTSKSNISFKNIAAFSYDYSTKELPYSQNEIRAIKDNFGPNAALFLGKYCTKDSFLKLNDTFNIVHLALHASNNSALRQDNKIFFSPHFEDVLTGIEVSATNLKPNLIVLSACQSGEGKQEVGEGIYSLSRAFHLSGINKIVASLWKIEDATTSEILKSFYKNLVKSNNPSSALSHAKRDYLKNSNYPLNHPKYWAGLIFLD